ncbi:hypothetical protein PNIG_a1377 [Pseudoalteromonas nigrifaciens]|uniref:Uncharacterized protein n=1 Tax=Pseudoalteromonas nigrifaciens TaxID=28109 RepID=A0AAC9UHD6_9GAMM|nr:hypothetical protein PNIG_a1377 [Pseudoalteromonas nigrifaciens]
MFLCSICTFYSTNAKIKARHFYEKVLLFLKIIKLKGVFT